MRAYSIALNGSAEQSTRYGDRRIQCFHLVPIVCQPNAECPHVWDRCGVGNEFIMPFCCMAHPTGIYTRPLVQAGKNTARITRVRCTRTSVRLNKRTPSRRETNHHLSNRERSQAIQAAMPLGALGKRCVWPNTSGRTTSRERWALRTNRKTSIVLGSTPLLPSSLNHQHRTHGDHHPTFQQSYPSLSLSLLGPHVGVSNKHRPLLSPAYNRPSLSADNVVGTKVRTALYSVLSLTCDAKQTKPSRKLPPPPRHTTTLLRERRKAS